MDLLAEITPPIEEPLPSNLTNVHFDPPREFVEDLWNWNTDIAGPHASVHSARLIPALRAIAAARNPEQALITSTIERLKAARAGTTVALSNAMADLSVTGRGSFQTFSSLRPTESRLLSAVMNASNLPLGATEVEIRSALTATLDRAYRVVWALRGAPSQRATLRPTLGWIAVSGEDDSPHAPVNIPCTNDPMGEINVVIDSIRMTLRAAIKLPNPAPGPIGTINLRSLPDETAGQQFRDLIGSARSANYDRLILFVHGLGSRLEEGSEFKQELINQCSRAGGRVAILSLDLPGFGYSSRLDLTSVVNRVGGTADFNIGNPLRNSRFPYLSLFRDTLEAISTRINGNYQFVIGGSLGGNMVLNLASNKPNGNSINSSSLRRFACWSPASIWESWARARLIVAPWDSGVYADVVKHEMVRRSRDSMNASENSSSRREWFDWIQRGSELLFFRVGGWIPKGGATRETLLYLAEIYSKDWRQTFWATSHEQLIFSHQEPLSLKNGQPTWPFRTIGRPLLIISGSKDGGGPDGEGFNPLNYYGNVDTVARSSADVPGQRLLLRGVGHSVHDERPRFLASRILTHFFPRGFPAPPPPPEPPITIILSEDLIRIIKIMKEFIEAPTFPPSNPLFSLALKEIKFSNTLIKENLKMDQSGKYYFEALFYDKLIRTLWTNEVMKNKELTGKIELASREVKQIADLVAKISNNEIRYFKLTTKDKIPKYEELAKGKQIEFIIYEYPFLDVQK